MICAKKVKTDLKNRIIRFFNVQEPPVASLLSWKFRISNESLQVKKTLEGTVTQYHLAEKNKPRLLATEVMSPIWSGEGRGVKKKNRNFNFSLINTNQFVITIVDNQVSNL